MPETPKPVPRDLTAKRYTVWISAEAHHVIRRIAFHEYKTTSGVIRELIEDGLKRRETYAPEK